MFTRVNESFIIEIIDSIHYYIKQERTHKTIRIILKGYLLGFVLWGITNQWMNYESPLVSKLAKLEQKLNYEGFTIIQQELVWLRGEYSFNIKTSCMAEFEYTFIAIPEFDVDDIKLKVFDNNNQLIVQACKEDQAIDVETKFTLCEDVEVSSEIKSLKTWLPYSKTLIIIAIKMVGNQPIA